MFREIIEIKKEEKNLNRNYGYLKIKPENEMTIDELNKMVLEMFELAAKEAREP